MMPMFEVYERDVPEQLVLTEQQRVLVQDLPGWQRTAIDRLMKSAQAYGGMSGPFFVIFHGEVNERSDGPVEVCVPVSLAEACTLDSTIRREPAHREAYVRVTRSQFDYPQILSAYTAVIEWIKAHGQSASGPTREIRLADLRSAAPTDAVCDVAFPLH
jgi:effector-binding domain-containing protein